MSGPELIFRRFGILIEDIQTLGNLECGPTYHMKEVIIYDFTKDWINFFHGDKKPVIGHLKRQRVWDNQMVHIESGPKWTF